MCVERAIPPSHSSLPTISTGLELPAPAPRQGGHHRWGKDSFFTCLGGRLNQIIDIIGMNHGVSEDTGERYPVRQ